MTYSIPPRVKLIQRYQVGNTVCDTKEEAADELRRQAILRMGHDWFKGPNGPLGKPDWQDFCDFILSERVWLREILGFTPDEIITNFSAGAE